jgi:hypothetical protein
MKALWLSLGVLFAALNIGEGAIKKFWHVSEYVFSHLFSKEAC